MPLGNAPVVANWIVWPAAKLLVYVTTAGEAIVMVTVFGLESEVWNH